MKAWMVFEYDPFEGCMLVFAENRNRAKVLGFKAGWFDEYIHLSANRQPNYDKFALKERTIESNEELPDDAPIFFTEVL